MGMDDIEVKMQIAIGTYKINKHNRSKTYNIIRNTEDPAIVKWAAIHEDHKIRAAAAKHPQLTLADFVRIVFFEQWGDVKKAAGLEYDYSVGWYVSQSHPRYCELNSLIEIIEDKYNG